MAERLRQGHEIAFRADHDLLDEVARQLNGRPRKTLGFETPAERFEACVAMSD